MTIFVTIAKVKAEMVPDFDTSVFLLINQSEDIGEKQHSAFGSIGGQISSLMHVAF